MNKQTKHFQEKRTEVMERLRESMGEDRTGELGDVDGVDLLSMFLRRAPDQESSDEQEPQEEFSKDDFAEIRRRRRQQKQAQAEAWASGSSQPNFDVDSDSIPIPLANDSATIAAMNFEALVNEIPRLRDNFSEWLSSVDAEYAPSSSTLEELERQKENIEYRLKVLTVMVNATQKELEDLIITIRAQETSRKD